MDEGNARGADAVKTRTGDRVEIEVLPGRRDGRRRRRCCARSRSASCTARAFTGGQAAAITPDASIYGQPFRFHTQEEVDKVRAQLDPQVKQSFEKAGFYAPGISGGGFAYLMSVREIHGKAEIKSAKVWVPQGDHIAEIAFRAAGVTPIPLPLADVYTSLQTGLIDTVANTTSGAIAFQWHTKVRYMLDLPLTYVIGMLVIDKKAVDALSADDQKVLNDEIGAAFVRLEKITRDDNAQAREALQKQGVKIAAPTATEIKEWDEIGAAARKEIDISGGISPQLAAAFDKALAAARQK